MDYSELETFIHKKMRMTHIYQPIMIKALLESDDNTANVDDIARKFLNNDESQLSYYKKIAKRWPHQTLKKHNVIRYKKGVYTLALERRLSRAEKARLSELCDLRLDEFVDKDPWIQKIRELERISPGKSLRYDIISKSKGVCVACGAGPPDSSLHIDHIVPASLGGMTELANLQALCYKCNTQKRNRDDLDFVKWRKRLQFRNSKCRFCRTGHSIKSNVLAHAIRAQDPATDLHSQVVPNRHVDSFIDLIPAEKQLCLALADEVMAEIKAADSSISDFDISGLDGRHEDHCRINIVPITR